MKFCSQEEIFRHTETFSDLQPTNNLLKSFHYHSATSLALFSFFFHVFQNPSVTDKMFGRTFSGGKFVAISRDDYITASMIQVVPMML